MVVVFRDEEGRSTSARHKDLYETHAGKRILLPAFWKQSSSVSREVWDGPVTKVDKRLFLFHLQFSLTELLSFPTSSGGHSGRRIPSPPLPHTTPALLRQDHDLSPS